MKIIYFIFIILIFLTNFSFGSIFKYKENSKNQNPEFLECMSALKNGKILSINKKSSKIVIFENSVYYISINANSLLCEKWGDLSK